MINIGQKCSPVTAVVLKGGRFTRFAVPMFHREGDRDVPDGLINILARGDYQFRRGDQIKMVTITGANVRNSKYFTLFAEIEYFTEAEIKAEPNRELLDANIPDDL